MFRWKHTISRVALKSAFALIGLIFLAAQLSGKFYACSSQAVITRVTKTLKQGVHSTDPRILSLDKRYKSQKIFVLWIAPLKHEFVVAPNTVPGNLSQPASLCGSQITTIALRGPPVAA